MAQLVSATVSLLYCFKKQTTVVGDKELLWPSFSHVEKTNSGLGPWRSGVSHYVQHRPLTQSLWGARPRAERDETITSAEVGFLASLSSERQAQKRQQTITIFSNWQELDSNGRLKGKKDLWALTFSIWKLFVKSGRGRKGQRTAVLRIWKFHPGSISSTKPRPQWTRVHTLNLPGSFYGACPQLAFLQLLCNWYHPKRKLSKPASHCLTKMPAFKYPSEEPLSLIIQLSSDQR